MVYPEYGNLLMFLIELSEKARVRREVFYSFHVHFATFSFASTTPPPKTTASKVHWHLWQTRFLPSHSLPPTRRSVLAYSFPVLTEMFPKYFFAPGTSHTITPVHLFVPSTYRDIFQVYSFALPGTLHTITPLHLFVPSTYKDIFPRSMFLLPLVLRTLY